MSIKFEWAEGHDTLGWRLLVNGQSFGRVVLRQMQHQAQRIEYVEDEFGYKRTCFRTLASSKDPDEMFDYLLSLARLKCSAT